MARCIFKTMNLLKYYLYASNVTTENVDNARRYLKKAKMNIAAKKTRSLEKRDEREPEAIKSKNFQKNCKYGVL